MDEPGAFARSSGVCADAECEHRQEIIPKLPPKKADRVKNKTEDFIKKAKEKHGDKYDYSKVEYIDSKTKVCIICKIHGDFNQIHSEHLRGRGCIKCSGCYSYTTEEWIKEAKKIHGEIYDYSKVDYINARTKVCIICNIHGKFLQLPGSHLSNKGCSKCGHEIKIQKLTSNTDEFIKKAKEIHGDKYDYSKVNYKHSKEKVSIICKIHGEFLQEPSKHLEKHGCNECGIEQSRQKQTSNTEEFIEKAKEIHGDEYDYSKVNYKHSLEKISIICNIHGEFLQTPSTHLSGCGCSKCSDCYSYTTEEWIKKAKEIHEDKYDYSKVNYINKKTKITITCKTHGNFIQRPPEHLSGYGCSKCSGMYSYTTEEWIKKVKIIHKDKYDYSKVNYINANEKVCIICNIHGKFFQVPKSHISGYGCNKCVRRHSKVQINWLDFISKYNEINIQHAENGGEHKILNSNYKADGFCEETNTIYEFHGDYWHGNPKIYEPNHKTFYGKTSGELYENTLKKETFIKEQGYNLTIIWESNWKQINNSIKKLQYKFKNYKSV